jgi:hypothetical protein
VLGKIKIMSICRAAVYDSRRVDYAAGWRQQPHVDSVSPQGRP